jgi:ATP-binding cassette subfamily B protein
VNANTFIERLPRGYDTVVTERGSTLSVGQKQLLAFARAIAFNPEIVLVLDEATSSVDTETEQLIQGALHKLMTGRTSIVIAHRLSTIQNVDRIIVLHKGRVVEVGSHRDLLSARGVYHRLYELQYRAADRSA